MNDYNVQDWVTEAQKTLATFHQQERAAGGLESIVTKLAAIADGQQGLSLTPAEAAAVSQACGVCCYLTNAILVQKHGPLSQHRKDEAQGKIL